MKYAFQILICAALLVACKNETAKTPSAPDAPVEASAILKHKYWVSKEFADALFAANVPDTLNRLFCSELMFTQKDTVWLTTCRWRSGSEAFKSTGVNSIEIPYDEKQVITHVLDEKTGILKATSPEETREYVGFDDINFDDLENNPPVGQLAQRRMAGNYRLVPKKGQVANAAIAEVRATGDLTNFEGFDSFFPIPTGVASYFNPKKEMMMVNFTKGKADISTICGVQLRGDTLFVFNSKDGSEGLEITNIRATYVKVRE